MVLSGVRNFHLNQALDCGQAFRWRECDGGIFSGIAHGRRLEIALAGDTLTIKNTSLHEFEAIWKNYFDLSRDYDELRKIFAQSGGEHLQAALEFSPGLRLLNQDTWEILVSFILSQNSNIPRIKKMIENLCTLLGEKLPCGGYTFPTAAALAAVSEQELAPIKCGYRAAYILDAAKQVASGKFNATALKNQPTAEIRESLLKIHGVGPKVADCVLLYGFSRTECYPADVWIKRVMTAFFPAGFPKKIEPHAGIAQQFLFHHVRTKKFFPKTTGIKKATTQIIGS
jgi:N-glycosylase/DNA lyase